MRSYTETEKLTAVRAVIVQGSFKAAEAATGIPYETIAGWKHRDPEWWGKIYAEICLELLQGMTEATQHQALDLREKLLQGMAERLANGDHKFNVKTGEIVRVPVALGDMTKTFIALGGQKAEPKPVAQQTEEERMIELSKVAEEDRASRVN